MNNGTRSINNFRQFSKTIDTINPYFTGGKLLLSRLAWDLHPYSWISRKRLKVWKNKFMDQKAVILCNGPSLNKVDFDELTNSSVFTFGLNKINLLFSRTDFRPSAILAVNPYVIEQNSDFYNQTQLPLFIDCYGKKYLKFRQNVHFLHSATSPGKFARDCSMSINQGTTVTYLAMQLAFHIGFAKVAIVGCDHSFSAKGPSNSAVVSGETDPDHFDPNYFSGGNVWQLPDLSVAELHYKVARDTFEEDGRHIVNCTEGGKLEVFERQKLSIFLNSD